MCRSERKACTTHRRIHDLLKGRGDEDANLLVYEAVLGLVADDVTTGGTGAGALGKERLPGACVAVSLRTLAYGVVYAPL